MWSRRADPPPGPSSLWLVRHGESAGNLARAAAYAGGAEVIELDVPDPEVSLSPLGEQQACGLGRWLGAQPPDRRPGLVVSSTYVRTRRTAELMLAEAACTDLPVQLEERLRDREQGVLDQLTWQGILARHPGEAERRRRLGKFYYRPPGGESWADVAARIRAVLAEGRLAWAGQRVLLVAHDVPILLVRYVLEAMTPEAVLALSGTVANCSLTRYERVGGVLRLESGPGAPVC